MVNDPAMMPSTNPAQVYELVALIVIFFLTSVIGVVTGSNSLITVPAMLAFGIEPRVALATNMFGLMFMSLGGMLPFLGSGAFDRRRLSFNLRKAGWSWGRVSAVDCHDPNNLHC